jgi:glucose-1-phosphate cytidylyltransferase
MDQIGNVAILCGGRGTRLQERTHSIPKALVEIGGRPILWHVIRIYAAQGLRRFVLLTGYLGDQIEEYTRSEEWPEQVEIECVDTGIDTPTGGRIKLASDRFGDRAFCATYADGVADLDLPALLRFHRDHGDDATVTVVRPLSQFGIAELDDGGRVAGFQEKPRLDHWVNGGFFVFEPSVLDYLTESSVLEQDPLKRLAAEGHLHGYRHEGFWDCMDTYKDAVTLNDLWADGSAPWAVWERNTTTGPGETNGHGRETEAGGVRG